MHLDNTAAIVTGAASGLGAATAAHLADRGATVYGLDLEKAVACVVPSAGVHLVPADVTDDEQVRAAVGRSATTANSCGWPSTAPASLRPRGSCPGTDRTTSTCSTAC